jgi:hypothetical protein
MSATGYVGNARLQLPMRTGIVVEVPVELFSNTYNQFLLIAPEQRSFLKRRVSFAVSK